MKKLLKLVAVAVLVASPIFVGVPASAQSTPQATCEIGYTGPDSNNQCTSTTEYRCEVTNTNTINIISSNDQESVSGGAFVGGNTTGGGSTSGTVTNTNGVVFNVTIVNTNPEPEEGEVGTCVATRTVPATIPPTPVVPTNGGGATVLPTTSGEQTLATVGLIAAGSTLLAITSVGAVYLYRRFKA